MTFPRNRVRSGHLASLFTAMALASGPSQAQNILPSHGVVTLGAASIAQSGAKMTVNQASPRAIVNWGSFSIGQGNGVTFDQPSASSAILNRVTGSTTSTIAGQLQANGQVYLVNPNGIAITKSGAVQVGGGFVASTLGITDGDFNKGNLNFVGNGASAGVSNAGSIAAAPGGFIGLLGGTVSNPGVVSVPLGKVAMGSGEQATLNLTGDNFLQVAVPTGTKTADGQALIDVSGKVRAAGGSVQLRAATVAQAIRNAVNVPGELSVTSARASGGSIILGGGPGGDVSVTGRLKASGRTTAGTITVGGHDVALRQATLAASSAKGRGGTVTVTGTRAVSLESSLVYASGATGGGAIRIGGDFHGASDLTSAQTTTIDSASTLNASATVSGDGGKVAVWSTGTTSVHGLIAVRGGSQSGDGGQIETSGESVDFGGASVDASSPRGKAGTWLVDPEDLTVDGAAATTIQNSLSGGTGVTLQTTSTTATGPGNVSSGAGDINVDAAISWSTSALLTLSAFHSIVVNAPLTISGSGGLNLTTNNNVGGTSTGDGALTFKMGQGSAQFTTPAAEPGLVINGDVYHLVSNMAGVESMSGSAENFALAVPINAAGSGTFTAAPVPTFGGKFEGLGNTISSLTIVATGDVNAGTVTELGLFGRLEPGGTIENMGLLSGSVTNDSTHPESNPAGQANASVGELVGFNNGGTITNVYATGSVSGGSETQSTIGGLVGAMGELFGGPAIGGTIVNSYATGAVSGSGNSSVIGGLVGLSDAGSTIASSNATGAISGSATSGFMNIGGLVGENNGSTITSSFATGAISGTGGASAIGGLVGFNNSGATISGSNASGAVSASGTSGSISIGGLVGENNASTIASSLAVGAASVTGVTSGVSDIGGLVGFNNSGATISGSNASGAVSASGTSGSISIGGLVGENNASTIASSLAVGAASVTGVTSGVSDIGGLVGFNNSGATISGSNASGAVSASGTSGSISIGGLSGENNASIITNAFTTGTVTSTFVGAVVGGLVGHNAGPISNASATGAVSGGANADVGGLAGDNYGSITSSYATGLVSGGGGQSGTAGGLVGFQCTCGTISSSYATGAVIGGDKSSVGGLVGESEGSIVNSYATGAVTGGALAAEGGLVGAEVSGSISNSYAEGTVSGGSGSDAGGLVGYQDGSIMNSYAVGNVSVAAGDGTAAGEGFAGGLVGFEDFDGSISNAKATGAVNGGSFSFAGGLAGYSDGSISIAYATGQVTAAGGSVGVTGNPGGNNGGAGGLIGWQDVDGTVSDAYATGVVIGGQHTDVGGLVGDQFGGIVDAYATGALSVGVSGNIGGLVGVQFSGGSLSNGYWDIFTTGQTTSSGGGTGLTTAQLQAALPTFQNPGAWGIVPGKSYPYLCVEFAACTVTPQVVSGVVYLDSSGITPEGVGFPVNALVNGATLNSAQTGGAVVTGANGYYYYLLAPGSIPASGAVLTYQEGDNPVQGAALANQIASGFASNVDIYADTLHIITPSTLYSTTKSDLTTAIGGNTPVSALIAALPNLTIDAANAFAIDQVVSYPSGVITATALGDLTISDGTSLAANSVTLATKSNFFNQSGAGAISLQGTGGRWLVYSTNPNFDTDGGLAPNFFQYNAPYTFGHYNVPVGPDIGTPPAASGNGFLYSYAPTIAITGVTKTYDATTALPSSAADFTFSGANAGDSVSLNFSGVAGSYATPNAGSGIDVTMTTLPTLIATRNGVPVYGYAVHPVTNDLIGTINQLALTASLIGTVEKTYDGTTSATLTSGNYSLVRFIGAQSATVTQTAGTYASPNAGSGIGVSATLTAGDFSAGSGTLLTNYLLPASASGDVGVIDPKALTYTVADGSSTYGTTATLGAARLFGVLPGDTVDPTVGAFSGATPVSIGPRTLAGIYSQEVTALSNANYAVAPSGNTPGTLTIDPLTITFSVADASSIFGTTPILGPATLFGVLPGDVVIPTVDAFLGAAPIALSPFTPVGRYAQLVTAISNPNYRIAPGPNFPGVLTVSAPTANPGAPSDPGFLPGLTQINNPAQTEYDVGGYEQVLPHFTVACNEPPSLPDPNRFSDPDQALRAISQSMENYFRRCQNPTQTTIGDALDAYAAKLQVLAPRLPPALRNVPAIVAEGARRVRAAASRAEAVAVLRQTVAAVHKEIALVLSDDPQTRSREVRDGDVIAGALGGASVALVNSGSL